MDGRNIKSIDVYIWNVCWKNCAQFRFEYRPVGYIGIGVRWEDGFQQQQLYIILEVTSKKKKRVTQFNKGNPNIL